MSLLNPTPGQMLDRLSILFLKIKAYEKAGKDTRGLEAEKRELRTHYAQLSTFASIRSLVDSLYDVNSQLWKCEDVVRSSAPDSDVLEAARRIPLLNDERARLIRELDGAYDWPEPIEEKVYNVSS